MLSWVLVGLLGYLLGSFPSGIVVGRLWGTRDLRAYGSGNTGTTNALKVLGPLPGVLVFVLDIGKGLAAAALPVVFLHHQGLGFLGALTAVIGHIYPVYVGFRGGKGLATGAAAVAYLMPWFLAAFVPVWALVYLWQRHVAFASAAALLAVVPVAVVLLPPWPAVASILGLALMFWRHWPEARRVFGSRIGA